MKLVSVVGARPQFVKAFPLSKALAAAPDLDEVVVHTGQHFDPNMSQIFFAELGIAEPHYNLNIHGVAHGEVTGRMLAAVEGVLLAERPDAVLVFGDTNSTLAGALAAAKVNIPVVHVEAGLRSFNRTMPEEINRVVTDHVSDILLCPTTTAVANLAAEGVTRGVHQVGDLMYDATLAAIELSHRHADILGRLGLQPSGYGVATIHRAENTADPGRLAAVFDFLQGAAREKPIVLPIHPRTRNAAAALGVATDRPGLRLIEPVGYLDMTQLLHHAAFVATDSGGVQKEAYFHRTPCVTLRSETEWVETVECGWNRLWTVPDYRPRREIHEYGGGDCARRCVDVIRASLTGRRAENN
jgi:UDP-GlcNAc3NAcA epimerase